MNKENRPVSPYATKPASQDFMDLLDKEIDHAETVRHAKGLPAKAVECINKCISWLNEYRRGMAHSLTHYAATDKANRETGMGSDLDAVCAFIQITERGLA